MKLSTSKNVILFSMLLISLSLSAQISDYRVIPLPNYINLTENEGSFILNAKTVILYPKGNDLMKSNAEFLAAYIKTATGIELKVSDSKKKKNSIKLAVNTSISQSDEAYVLVINKQNITVTGSTEKGVFYGIQTLRKATPIQSGRNSVDYAAVKITDEPRFSYRGVMLDVSRYFQPVDYVKRFIDILALHNINQFHWHLTDDQGWRIEIKKYPLLTTIGSVRSETVIGKNTGRYDGKPHAGYYSQEEIKDIVKYAAERYITIIPEIDLPGHMGAALASYPSLGCVGKGYEVSRKWGVHEEVLCAGKDETYVFLENVLNEVMDLFPSKYIHIGGDECPKVRWESCDNCQNKIKELNLTTNEKHKKEFYLQSYVMKHCEEFVNKKGRVIIGWDEILEGEIAPNAVVMSWRGMKGGIQAANIGHGVIMSPKEYAYFDYYQSKPTSEEPFAIGGYVPVEKVYSFEPIPEELSCKAGKNIIGVQANLWTEYISTGSHAEYMLLPRLAAMCEVQWTKPERKNYVEFIKNLPKLIEIYEKYNYNFAKHVVSQQQ